MSDAARHRWRLAIRTVTAGVLVLAAGALASPAARSQEPVSPPVFRGEPQSPLSQLLAPGPAQPPLAPSRVTVRPLDAAVSIDWQSSVAPDVDPVQSYIVRSDDGRVLAEVPGGFTWTVIPAAQLAGSTTFNVLARNGAGDSPPSPASQPVSPSQPVRAGTAEFSGRLTTWSGEPVQANFRVTKSYSQLGSWGTSDSDGRFRLDVPTGVVLLDLNVSQGAALSVSTVLSISDSGLQQDLRIPDTVDVPVKVRDGSGGPLAGATLLVGGKPQSLRPSERGSVPFELMPGVVLQGGTWIPDLRTDGQGKATFQIRQSVESTYIGVRSAGATLRFPTKGLSMGAGPCPSPCTAPPQLITAVADTTLSGRLVTRSGAPVPGSSINISGYGKTQVYHETWAQVAADGSYSIPAPIGRPDVALESFGSPNGPYFALETSIAVGSGPVTLQVPDPVNLEVTVLGASGPLADACVWVNEPDSIEYFDSGRVVPFDIAAGAKATGYLFSPTKRTGADGRAVLPVLPATDLRTLFVVASPTSPYGCGGDRLSKAPFDTTPSGTTMRQTFDIGAKRPVRLDAPAYASYLAVTDAAGDVVRISNVETRGLVTPGPVTVDARTFLQSGSLETRYQFPITVERGTGEYVLSLNELPPQSDLTVRTVNRNGPAPYQAVEVAADTTSLQECLDENPLAEPVRPVAGVEVPGCFSAGGAVNVDSTGEATAGNLAGRVKALQVRGPLLFHGFDNYLVAGSARDVTITSPRTLVEIPLNRPAAPTSLALTPAPPLLRLAEQAGTAGEYLLSWESPLDLGSGRLVAFDVAAVPLDGPGPVQRLTTAADATSALVTGLTPGERYRISATAITSAGAGPARYAEVTAPTTGAEGGTNPEPGGGLVEDEVGGEPEPSGGSTGEEDGSVPGGDTSGSGGGPMAEGSAADGGDAPEALAGEAPGAAAPVSSGGTGQLPAALILLLLAAAGFVLLWYVLGPRRDASGADSGAERQDR